MQILYPDTEKSKLDEIDKLLKSWKETVSDARVKWRDNGKYYSGSDWFSEDGFFPYYFSQNYRILFVGREDRNCWNTVNNWMEIFHTQFVEDKGFFKPLMKILYSIENGFHEDYEKIPSTDEIVKTIGKPDGLSFSIMELSKYGNENYDSQKVDKALIEQFFEDSKLDKRNFYEEELKILDPHLIITMNLRAISNKINNYIDKYFFGRFNFTPIKPFGDTYLHSVIINGKKIPLIDTYHFSAIMSTKEVFYNPIIETLNSDTFNEIFSDFNKGKHNVA